MWACNVINFLIKKTIFLVVVIASSVSFGCSNDAFYPSASYEPMKCELDGRCDGYCAVGVITMRNTGYRLVILSPADQSRAGVSAVSARLNQAPRRLTAHAVVDAGSVASSCR